MPEQRRVLVVNADDFGLSRGVNRGITFAHEWGIVTSASLMVRQAGAEDAAAYARSNPRLGVGLHIDLGEWSYRGGEWVCVYEVVGLDDAGAVTDEVSRQLDAFHRLVGRPPTHLDSHQHVHRSEPLRGIVAAAGERLGAPVRHVTPGIRSCGDFYGLGWRNSRMPEAITADALLRVLRSLQPGVTELMCHPGYDPDLRSDYRDERLAEVTALCDPAVRRAVEEQEIEVRTFADVAESMRGGREA